MASHTPGPWKVESFDPTRVIDQHNSVVCDTMDSYFVVDVCKENARLIAAAPELLEMVDEMRCQLFEVLKCSLLIGMNGKIRTMIAKAERLMEKA
jgi:hypothetical protein